MRLSASTFSLLVSVVELWHAEAVALPTSLGHNSLGHSGLPLQSNSSEEQKEQLPAWKSFSIDAGIQKIKDQFGLPRCIIGHIQDVPASNMIVLLLVVGFLLRQVQSPKAELPATSAWTGVRAVIALTIMIEHLGIPLPQTGGGFFLILSGCMLSCSGKLGSLDTKGYFKWFFIRVSRVYPAWWAFLFLSGDWPVTFERAFLLKSFGTSFEGHLWFLHTIMVLYLVFPLFAAMLSKLGVHTSIRRGLLAAGVCYLAQIMIFIWIQGSQHRDLDRKHPFFMTRSVFGWPVRVYDNPIFRFPQMALGVVCGQIWLCMSSNPKEGDEFAQKWMGDGMGIVIQDSQKVAGRCVDLITMVLVFFFMSHRHGYTGDRVFDNHLGQLNMASPLFVAWLLLLAKSGRHSLSGRFLNTPLLQELGTTSYGVYLWHYTIWTNPSTWCGRLTCEGKTQGFLLYFYAYAVACGIASFYLVERPVQNVARQLLK